MIRNNTRLTVLLLSLSAVAVAQAEDLDPQGAWSLDEYVVKSGPVANIKGSLMLSNGHLAIFYRITDANGVPIKGELETGTYTVQGREIVFSNDAVMTANTPTGQAPTGTLKVLAPPKVAHWKAERSERHLTVIFESGNRMKFSLAEGE